MTNRKEGLASYDNDQQRQTAAQPGRAEYEKGSAMDRGTSHEFSTEQVSEVGCKGLEAADPPPGTTPAERKKL